MKVRASIGISLDGFGTGEGLSAEAPFGHAGMLLVDWLKDTAAFREAVMGDGSGGTAGVDDAFARRLLGEAGAEIMGARKFGPPGWHDDPGWCGWWGDAPPFRTPVFVLTHHERAPLAFANGTTFHFISADPHEALATAAAAANGRDVRIGGGPTVTRAFLAAGLVDELHVAVAPVILGRGVRLWDGLEGFETGYIREAVSSPSGATHITFRRRVDAAS